MFIALRAYVIFAEGAGGLMGCVSTWRSSGAQVLSSLAAINIPLLRRENLKLDLSFAFLRCDSATLCNRA